jgi:hypothetical protein
MKEKNNTAIREAAVNRKEVFINRGFSDNQMYVIVNILIRLETYL